MPEPYVIMVRVPLEAEEAASVAELGELPQQVTVLGVMRERDFAAVMGLSELPTPPPGEMQRQADLLRGPTSETLKKEQP